MAENIVGIYQITYGDHVIHDWDVSQRIRNALHEREAFFKVTNEVSRNAVIDGDPNPGVRKELVIDYCDYWTGPKLRISALERNYMHFAPRIAKIRYGGVELNDHPGVVNRMNLAMMLTEESGGAKVRTMIINNENMGGDTRPGVVKHAEVQILCGKGAPDNWVQIKEGEIFPDPTNLPATPW